MAARILNFQEESLNELSGIQDDIVTGMEREDWSRRATLLLESGFYSVKEHTLLGLFPVYTVDINIEALMDTMTLTAIKHSIEERNGIPEDFYHGDE